MLKKSIIPLFVATFFINCKNEKPLELNSTNSADIINQEFTGDVAFETTSFLEKYWRAAGNTGFNITILSCTLK